MAYINIKSFTGKMHDIISLLNTYITNSTLLVMTTIIKMHSNVSLWEALSCEAREEHTNAHKRNLIILQLTFHRISDSLQGAHTPY